MDNKTNLMGMGSLPEVEVPTLDELGDAFIHKVEDTVDGMKEVGK